jgi:hypothetical protein
MTIVYSEMDVTTSELITKMSIHHERCRASGPQEIYVCTCVIFQTLEKASKR